MERSAHFVEILERYGGEVPVLSKVHRLFREEAARRAAREERESGTAAGADDALQPYFVVQEWLAPSVAGLRGVLGLRVTVLTGGEQLLAFCQIKEESVHDPAAALSHIRRSKTGRPGVSR